MKCKLNSKNPVRHKPSTYKKLLQVRHELIISQTLIQQYVELLLKLQLISIAKQTIIERINKHYQ